MSTEEHQEVIPKPGIARKCCRTSSCVPVLPFPYAKAIQLSQEHRPEKQRGEMGPAAAGPTVLAVPMSPPTSSRAP